MKNEVFDFYDRTSLKSYNLDEKMRYQLNMLDTLDVFTRKHSENVASVTCRLCEYLHCNKGFTEFCTIGAYLHDVGKLYIPPQILQKPGKLTDEEYEIMKTHAAEGARIVHEILKDTDNESFKIVAENVAHYHHERMDGSGYPEHLEGDKIPLEARIMAIADVYDALVSKRVYKESMSFEQADKIMMESMGKHFDKQLEKYYISARPKLEAYYTSLGEQTNAE